MYPPHLAYLLEKGTIWFNPSYGITVFWDEYRKLMLKFGKTKDIDGFIWRHKDLKRAKEIFTISIIAKAMSKQDNKSWWVIKPKKDPPDGVVGTIIKNNSIEEMHVREVEVVENVSGEILETIKDKLSHKKYEPNTILACYLSRGGIFDLKKVAMTISQEITSLNNIFIIFPGVKMSNVSQDISSDNLLRSIFKITVVQIKPIFTDMTIDPIEDCKDWRDKKEGSFFIFEGRGKGGSRNITLKNAPKLF